MADGTGSCVRPQRLGRRGPARADMRDSFDRLLEEVERGTDRREAIAFAVVGPLVLLHRRVVVAVHRDVREADLLSRRRAAGPRDAGDAETDLRTEALSGTARERRGYDRGDRAVSVNEVGSDVGEDRLGLIRIDDRAALEVLARAAVRGE